MNKRNNRPPLKFEILPGKISVAVGSQNPLKLEAARSVISRIVPEAEFVSLPADSGVSANPASNRETIEGARARAEAARKESGADWGVGLEGGITPVGEDWFTCVWCVIRDGERETRGGGVHFQLPPDVLKVILEDGGEMGDGMDELTGLKMTKRRMGAEGILTGGLVDRKTTFETALIYALAPWLSADYYNYERRRRS